MEGVPLFREAIARHQAGDLEAATGLYLKLLSVEPDHAGAWANLAAVLLVKRREQEAIACCRKALAVNDKHAEAWNNLGILLGRRQRHEESVQAYEKCLASDPRHYLAWTNLGLGRVRLGEVERAVQAFEQALRLRPDHTEALIHLIHQRQQLAHWEGLDQLVPRLARQMRQDVAEVNPFSYLFLCNDPAEQRLCASHYAKRVEKVAARLEPLPPFPAFEATSRLRIAYLSADFHQHATALLAAELFEAHDRERFEVFAYSFGPEDGGPLRARIRRGVEHFVDVAALGDRELAGRIRQDGIHILMDLKGFTRDARPTVLALRPAPVQINFLAYPGTMAASFIDYILADEVVLPAEMEPYFDEKPIRLPVCYQVNDSRRRIDTPGARRDYGLPEEGFVFCSFNQTAKITPEFFGLWLELLRRVPGSVLWLMAFHPDAQKRLRARAEQGGIAGERLIFAPPLPNEAHLARYAVADLALDTLPCNGHTTTSDALWGGCPVLTCQGRTFAGRVSASLLTALELPELITDSPADYGRKALQLAKEPQRLSALRQRLQSVRPGHALFDGKAFTREWEKALLQVWQRYQRVGEEGFSVGGPDSGATCCNTR
ncbi:MAG: tetratricopeptide repeat protein [Magnetococcales bacterium]|nr:tetratricopeptide repeat protein [Magnetococcales bacterium]